MRRAAILQHWSCWWRPVLDRMVPGLMTTRSSIFICKTSIIMLYLSGICFLYSKLHLCINKNIRKQIHIDHENLNNTHCTLLWQIVAQKFLPEFLYELLLMLSRCFHHLLVNSILYRKDVQHFYTRPILFSWSKIIQSVKKYTLKKVTWCWEYETEIKIVG